MVSAMVIKMITLTFTRMLLKLLEQMHTTMVERVVRTMVQNWSVRESVSESP